MRWKRDATYHELLEPAMDIAEQEEADRYLEDLVYHYEIVDNLPRGEAEGLAKANLGYYAGYFDQETRLRVERLFKCEHPLLGPATIKRTPEEIFKLGQEYGMRMRKGSQDDGGETT